MKYYRKNSNIKKKRRTVFRRLLLVFISLFLGVSLYLWNANTLAGNEMPMPFGYGVSVVLSGSMEPVLSVNDVVLIHHSDTYEEGDVVVYQTGNELIIHRIIEKNEDFIQTKGDANNAADTPVNIKAVKGKLVGHIPFVGIIVKALKTPFGVMIILVSAFALLELSYRREKASDFDEIERMKEEIRKLKAQ